MPDNSAFSLADLTNTLLNDLQAIAQSPNPLNTPEALEKLTLLEATKSQISAIAETVSIQQDQQIAQQRQQFTQRRENFQKGLQQRQQLIEQALVKRRESLAQPIPDKFVVTGQILDEATGNGLPNVEIRAFDYDRTSDDFLGVARTDADGFYRLEYTQEQFQERGEGRPEVYIQVKDRSENIVFQSPRSFDNNEGTVKKLDARIDGSVFPESRVLASTVVKLRSQRIHTLLEKQQSLKIRTFNRSTDTIRRADPDITNP